MTAQATRLPTVVYVLGAGIFLMGTTEFMLAGLLPEVAGDLGVDIGRAGLLVTAFAVGMIIGPPVMALATVRLPAKATLIGALAVFAFGHVLGAVSDSFTVVTASRVVTALATGTFWAVGAVTATRAAGPGASARALAVMSGGLSLAVVAGVPLGTFAGQLTGWRGSFWILAILSLVTIVAVVKLTPADDRETAAVSLRAQLSAEVAGVRPWRMWVVLAVITLAQAGFLGAYSYISPLLTDRAGIASALVPLVLVGFGIGAVGGTALGGRLGDRFPLPVIAAAITATATLLLVLAATASHSLIVVGVVVLLGATGLGANPVLIAQTMRHAAPGSTLASSLATAAFNLGTAAGSALAATTLTTALGVVGPAVLGAGLTASALIPLALLAATARHRPPPPTPGATENQRARPRPITAARNHFSTSAIEEQSPCEPTSPPQPAATACAS
ncbi:MFS transporter [Nocardia neocaledoniensis NBRC 108232]|uniref:DHA1 family inner membrane transport protein n=1 Tax=Nocardia neocaledoniensis TaxID=236511 RepID=A0A317NZW1_9NOCA|nr:MFS transporter [Nocardia neocaledoniensis]PWV79714.1 DHA1 family inner membrane transport protein [Nocardia neocaledoniensis]GEM31499.1 MFS transporter [Nocardia neocaledoniensis NBRC 108232]